MYLEKVKKSISVTLDIKDSAINENTRLDNINDDDFF